MEKYTNLTPRESAPTAGDQKIKLPQIRSVLICGNFYEERKLRKCLYRLPPNKLHIQDLGFAGAFWSI